MTTKRIAVCISWWCCRTARERNSIHPGTLVTVNTYNPLGEITQATLGNGIVRNVGYDTRGRATSLTDGSIYSYALGYAGDSNILTGNDSINGNWTYTYDDFNRIATSNKNNSQQAFSYAYDRYGNRWQQNVTAGTGPYPQYSFNSNNQITTSGVTYDAAGNITNDNLGNTYAYDAENRVITVSGTNSASYVYDAFGQRVRSTINTIPYDFIYNNGAAVDEVTSSGWQWGDAGALHLAMYASSTTYFNHSDWLGSTRAWSSVSGSSLGTCANLAFGDAQTCTGTQLNAWAYTGLPYDSETGLTHALFRQLSTAQGRWTTTDPAGIAAADPTNPQSWNRYAYVENTPVNANDPLGLHCPVYVNPPPPGCGSNNMGSDVWTDWGWNNSVAWGFGGSGGGGGFSVGFSGDLCNDFTPCGMPLPSLAQSIWSDLLGLPSGLNCPQVGGISNLLCGGVSPIMDAEKGPGTNCTPLTAGCSNVPTAQQLAQYCVQLKVNQAARTAGRNWLIGEGVAALGGGVIGGFVAAGFTTATESYPFAGQTIPAGIASGAIWGATEALPYTTGGALVEFAFDAYGALSECR